jgi:hypothetical protein
LGREAHRRGRAFRSKARFGRFKPQTGHRAR